MRAHAPALNDQVRRDWTDDVMGVFEGRFAAIAKAQYLLTLPLLTLPSSTKSRGESRNGNEKGSHGWRMGGGDGMSARKGALGRRNLRTTPETCFTITTVHRRSGQNCHLRLQRSPALWSAKFHVKYPRDGSYCTFVRLSFPTGSHILEEVGKSRALNQQLAKNER